MAGRKSKKDLLNNNKVLMWNIGVYCRLSCDDDGDNVESDSIINQRDLINYYLKNEHNFKIIDYYVDDGYSGTNFNRPGFNRMIMDLTSGKINTIIVKDLSRFGRNYIETGNYLENVFPIYNTRFIAINDNIDSFKDPKSISNVVVSFKNLMNDEYARDISNKIKSALFTKAKKGEFVGGTTPYGYKKDKRNKYKLVIDEKEAEVVKLMYKKALEGDGTIKICKYLNDNNILCRKEIQRRERNNISLTDTKIKKEYSWCKRSVNNILTNETYIGNLVYNRTGVVSYKNKKRISKSKDEWIVVKNTHKGIIDVKDFEKVVELIRNRKNISNREAQYSIYNGKLKCGNCGYTMCKKKYFVKDKCCTYYVCRRYEVQTDKCVLSKIREEQLNDIVLETIMFQVKMVLSLEKVLKKLRKNELPYKYEEEYINKINKLKNNIDNLKKNKKISYEEWKLGNISKEDFLFYSKDYDEKIIKLNDEIKVLENIYIENVKNMKKDDYWIEHYRRNKNIKILNKEVLEELIECIYVYDNANIKIKFKYQDEYEKVLEFINGEEKRNNEQMECGCICAIV